MKIFRNLVLGTVMTISIACSSPQANQPMERLPIRPNANGLASFIKTVESIKMIPLEQNSEALIGGITGIEHYENRFFILDFQFTKSVFIYNDKGGLIKTINAIGKGPGEYVFPMDIAIDPYNKRLAIVDSDGHKVLLYNLDGQYITEIKLDFAPHAIGFINEETLVLKTMSKKRIPIIVSTNYSGDKVNTLLHSTFEFNRTLFNHFPRYNNQQLYNEFLNDTIYKVDENGIHPYLWIDFLENRVDGTTRSNLKTMVNEKRIAPRVSKSFAGGIKMYQETEDFNLITCSYLGEPTWTLNSKKSDYQLRLARSSDQTSSLIELFFTCQNIDNQGQLVSICYAYRVDELFNNPDFIELKDRGIISIETNGYDDQSIVDIDSNPIVVLVKLNLS